MGHDRGTQRQGLGVPTGVGGEGCTGRGTLSTAPDGRRPLMAADGQQCLPRRGRPPPPGGSPGALSPLGRSPGLPPDTAGHGSDPPVDMLQGAHSQPSGPLSPGRQPQSHPPVNAQVRVGKHPAIDPKGDCLDTPQGILRLRKVGVATHGRLPE